MSNPPWQMARRAARLNPSTIREILKLTERPGIISLAGGLPAAETFPVEAMRVATERVLREQPREALQYAASEGYGPLREWVAGELAAMGLAVPADLAVVGFGDVDFSADTRPALTTVHINAAAIGRQAAHFIVERAEGRAVEPRIVDIGFSIVERESG